jgi:hypothetical protein
VTRIFEWCARFLDGLENLEDDLSGRPTAVRTPGMIQTVRELISTVRRTTLRMMEEELEISRETIRSFLVEDLGKRKICARFVPHYLADEHNALRLQACQEFFNL